MAIQNLSGFSKILNSYNSNKWSGKNNLSELDIENLNFKDQLTGAGKNVSKTSFGDFLSSSINEVNGLQDKANVAIQKLVTGENKNIHETMMAVERAEIAFKSMNQIRQKVIEAYKTIMRMQV